MRIEVWDSDLINDDLVAEGSFNLMKVYSMPSMHSNNGTPPTIQNTLTFSTKVKTQAAS